MNSEGEAEAEPDRSAVSECDADTAEAAEALLRSRIVNREEAEEHGHLVGRHWGSFYRVLTPAMTGRDGRLGVNLTRVPPGRTTCPMHHHRLEDEVFYVLSGRGVFRYGEAIAEIGPGDCVSCPAGVGVAHQLANPFKEDLVYLAIGPNFDDEVCAYPDSGKVYVRGLGLMGFLDRAGVYHGEAGAPPSSSEDGDGSHAVPTIFALHPPDVTPEPAGEDGDAAGDDDT